MPAFEFLSQVWGAGEHGELSNTHFIAEHRPNGWMHHPVKSVSDALDKASRISADARDAYFACAEYKTESSRRGDNAVGACSFWADIDCGEEKAAAKRGYTTQLEALQALRKFCERTRVPLPTVVSSGNGLHCYWILTSIVPVDQWRIQAKSLKSLFAKHGLLADPARTTDIASVLRVPGTMNWKGLAL